jgi:hypothetical protein
MARDGTASHQATQSPAPRGTRNRAGCFPDGRRIGYHARTSQHRPIRHEHEDDPTAAIDQVDTASGNPRAAAPPDARRTEPVGLVYEQQALGALGELLRGFQAADQASAGRLLGDCTGHDPGHVHGGLLTTLLRLVFLLHAEDHGLMSESELYRDRYSVTGLHRRLREDADRYPDTMDQRHGAWAWLLGLFRLVYDGGGCAGPALPARRGQLFDPDEYPFLEGRPRGLARAADDVGDPPGVSDGCILRVLQALLVLDGERLSYRSLDVEHIGSVYEAMMGLALERAAGSPGGLSLQPGQERRRSGSHYTPRELTGPIVRTTLAPVLTALGERPTPEQILGLKVCDPAMGSGAFLVEACRQLAEALVAAWERHACMPVIPPDEDPLLCARRLVAQRCLYGVDRNPFAVSLAKLSLWLVTRARNHAFTFLDHALEHGDSLVGLGPAQSRAFAGERGQTLRERAEALREREPAVRPFHWAIEFPEVFERDDPGFDAIVGNPPFMQKNDIALAHPPGYSQLLLQAYEGASGKSDLVAFFFRRSFELLNAQGALGLIATNTISQGHTRTTGLGWICTHGGFIYDAQRRYTWPSAAAVIVSVVHISKREPRACRLDGKRAPKITAFLFHGGSSHEPAPMPGNRGMSFHGCDISGKGFTFDDESEEASPVSRMQSIISRRASYHERIFPYIGGEEINQYPDQNPRRYVFGFGRMPAGECWKRWPLLMEIAEKKVKPDREARPRNAQSAQLAARWWQWHTDRPTLRSAIAGASHVFVNCQVSPHVAFSLQPASRVFAHTLNVFATDSMSFFAVMQSRIHETWARFFGSSMKDDLRYTLGSCFETFPFPLDWRAHAALVAAGKAYYELRAALMVRNHEGLTRTYNRFHDPGERDPDLLRLRALHAAMDRAVLDSYGWTDILTECTFLLDYAIDEATWGARKKPYRYRWPEDVRDEVLARLLALNHERAEAERRAGDPGAPAAPAARQPRKRTPAGKQPRLRKSPAPDQPTPRSRSRISHKPSAQANLCPSPEHTDD